MKEIWKDIPGYEGYQVSSYGHVRSFWKKGQGGINCEPQRVLQPSSNGHYLGVSLMRKRKPVRFNIHRLVAHIFIGPCPEKLEVCHNDGDSQNNRIENLRYDTKQQNGQDRARLRFSENDVIQIRTRVYEKELLKSVAQDFSCGQGTIRRICTGVILPEYGGPIYSSTSKQRKPYGETKITYEDAQEIRHKQKQGVPQIQLAREYNCSESYISHIIHNRRFLNPPTNVYDDQAR